MAWPVEICREISLIVKAAAIHQECFHTWDHALHCSLTNVELVNIFENIVRQGMGPHPDVKLLWLIKGLSTSQNDSVSDDVVRYLDSQSSCREHQIPRPSIKHPFHYQGLKTRQSYYQFDNVRGHGWHCTVSPSYNKLHHIRSNFLWRTSSRRGRYCNGRGRCADTPQKIKSAGILNSGWVVRQFGVCFKFHSISAVVLLP